MSNRIRGRYGTILAIIKMVANIPYFSPSLLFPFVKRKRLEPVDLGEDRRASTLLLSAVSKIHNTLENHHLLEPMKVRNIPGVRFSNYLRLLHPMPLLRCFWLFLISIGFSSKVLGITETAESNRVERICQTDRAFA